jgi:hypothetical protein
MTLLTLRSDERFVANSTEVFQYYGVEMEVGYDFEVYRDILSIARPDQAISRPFDPDFYDLNAGNALWMLGRTANGEIVHTQALRMLNLNGQTIADYFAKDFRNFPPPVPGLDEKRSRFRAGPYAKRSRGRVCYDGEFWIKPGDASLRGQGLSSILGRYAFFQAMQHWDPDHMVAFMAKQVACKGFPQRLGWMHSQPGAVRWFRHGSDDPMEGFMTFMSREDMHYVLELPLQDYVALAA